MSAGDLELGTCTPVKNEVSQVLNGAAFPWSFLSYQGLPKTSTKGLKEAVPARLQHRSRILHDRLLEGMFVIALLWMCYVGSIMSIYQKIIMAGISC